MAEIYVGNLNYAATDESLSELFREFGTVDRASIITDRITGRSRGFGFVTMADEGEANQAIEGINGREIEGRTLTCNIAKPRGDRADGGGGGGGGGNW